MECECGHPWFPWHGHWEDDERVLCLCKTCSCNSCNLLADDKVRSQDDPEPTGQGREQPSIDEGQEKS